MRIEKMMDEIFTRRDFGKAALCLAGISFLTGQGGNAIGKSIHDMDEKKSEALKQSTSGHWCIPH
jgi:hypothetical protein